MYLLFFKNYRMTFVTMVLALTSRAVSKEDMLFARKMHIRVRVANTSDCILTRAQVGGQFITQSQRE